MDKPTKSFSVPASYTVTGWVEIKARDLEEAKRKAERMNDEGIDEGKINDGEARSEVFAEEIEEL